MFKHILKFILSLFATVGVVIFGLWSWFRESGVTVTEDKGKVGEVKKPIPKIPLAPKKNKLVDKEKESDKEVSKEKSEEVKSDEGSKSSTSEQSSETKSVESSSESTKSEVSYSLNPTTTITRVSEEKRKEELAELNKTKKVTISVPKKERPSSVGKEGVTFTKAPTTETYTTTNQKQGSGVYVASAPTTSTTTEKQISVISEKGQPLVQAENSVGVVSDKGSSLVQPTVDFESNSNTTSKPLEVSEPTSVVSEKGQALVQAENPVGVVSENGPALVQEENPIGFVSEAGEPLVQEENPIGFVSEVGEPLVQEVLPEYVISEVGEPLVQEVLPEYVISEVGESLVQEDLPQGVVSEKGEPLVQGEVPVYVSPVSTPIAEVVSEKGIPEVQTPLEELVISEKGQPLVQATKPEVVLSQKGDSLVQEENPIGVVSEKGESLVQPNLPEGIVTEKGQPLVQDENPMGVVPEKGESLVQPSLPVGVVTEKGEPLVQPENPITVVSEKGEPLVQPENPTAEVPVEVTPPKTEPKKPLGIVFEKGEPEVLLGTLPEYKFKIVRREDVTPIATAFVNIGDFSKEVGYREKVVEGELGELRRVFEDVVGENGLVLNSTLKSETVKDPIYHVYRFGTKPVGSNKGESGLYRLHEHTSRMDIVEFRQDVTLTGAEIKALGQDEINKRAATEGIENSLTLSDGKNSRFLTIANAPLSDETIQKLNQGEYLNHKNVGLEVLKLVNQERKRLGLSELSWSDELFTLTKVRAGELGRNGHIRFWNEKNEVLKHVRDDKGTSWVTVVRNTPFAYNWMGENLAGYTMPRNIYQAFSEKVIAERLYTMWRNSPGHYANMVSPKYTKFAFDVAFSEFWRNNRTDLDYLAQGLHGVQLFSN